MADNDKKTQDNQWWKGAVFYQVYPRSFGDSNADGCGDLKGITQRLDYIASLGVDAVWISPFFKSPMADFGYDVSDYKEIDPLFGTMADFDTLLAEMHKRGLRLIVDLVLNHSSEKHPWFQESRSSRSNAKQDWYVWANPKPDGTPPNNWLSVFGGSAWQFDSRRGQYYFHQFLKEQPDLNILNPEVQATLLEIMEWWLKKGVDGFRLDALNHCMHDAQLRDNPARTDIDLNAGINRFTNPYSLQWHNYDKTQPEMVGFIAKLRALTDRYPNSMMVAEVNDTIETIRLYTNGRTRLHTAYSFTFLEPEYGTASVRRKIGEHNDVPSESWPSWAFSNHDVVRSASRWAQGGKPSDTQVKMLMALLTSLRGTAFIYQGEELGLTEADISFEDLQDPFGKFLWPEDKGRDGSRTPMPWAKEAKNAGFSTAEKTWLPIPPEHRARAVDVQENELHSPLHFTRRFLKWRKQHAPLVKGTIRFMDAPSEILLFVREHEGQKILCAFNMSATAAEMPLDVQGQVLEGIGLSGKFEDGTLSLPAFGAVYMKI